LKSGFGFGLTITYLRWIWIGFTIQKNRIEQQPDNKLFKNPFQWLNGRYLMSKYSNDGHKLNHMILSPCTKALVRANLVRILEVFVNLLMEWSHLL
jgi:hypothetical protein